MSGPTDADRAKAGEVGGDSRPHSRACGWRRHPHGPECHEDCPTCGGGQRVADDVAPMEVTEKDHMVAMRVLGIERPWAPLTEAIAAALAAERAAAVADLRARVEAVAEELEREANADLVPGKATRDQVRAGTMLAAAARIRAAVTDTTGGTQ